MPIIPKNITISKDAIRDASSIILHRLNSNDEIEILMGKRGKKAVFMPLKYVFPGGAVDESDAKMPTVNSMCPNMYQSLQFQNSDISPHTLANAALRELWEETSLILSDTGPTTKKCPKNWIEFHQKKHYPNHHALRFIFRAITPPNRPRRFDTRFFLVNAKHVSSNLNDFTSASDELSDLKWVTLKDVHSYNLPFITKIIINELPQHLQHSDMKMPIPFFHQQNGHLEISILK